MKGIGAQSSNYLKVFWQVAVVDLNESLFSENSAGRPLAAWLIVLGAPLEGQNKRRMITFCFRLTGIKVGPCMSVFACTSPWLISSIVPERRGNLMSCILQACSKLWRSLRFCSSLVSMAVTSFWSWVNSLEGRKRFFLVQTDSLVIFRFTWNENY